MGLPNGAKSTKFALAKECSPFCFRYCLGWIFRPFTHSVEIFPSFRIPKGQQKILRKVIGFHLSFFIVSSMNDTHTILLIYWKISHDVMWLCLTWCDCVWCKVIVPDVMWLCLMWCDCVWCDVIVSDVMWLCLVWSDCAWYDVIVSDVMWCDCVWCDVMWLCLIWCDCARCDMIVSDVKWLCLIWFDCVNLPAFLNFFLIFAWLKPNVSYILFHIKRAFPYTEFERKCEPLTWLIYNECSEVPVKSFIGNCTSLFENDIIFHPLLFGFAF